MTNNDITYLGRTFKTSISKPMTDEEYSEVVKHIKTFPDKKSALKELMAIHNGGTVTANVTGHYFLDLMYDTRNGQDAWSVNEALSCKKVIEYFNGKCSVNDKVYPPGIPLGERIKTAFRLCGIRCCRKVPQFPIKVINSLLDIYTMPGDNYYDFSCGWGMRALSAMIHGVNYFGTDPNARLVEKIYEMKSDYDSITHKTHNADIRPIGSEVFIKEWEDKIDFAFSSPPYFKLELYKSDNQSCKEDTEYQDWLDKYLEPTFINIYRYLKHDGIFAINIKDVTLKNVSYSLESDSVDLAQKSGFELYEVRTLNNVKRTFGSKHWDKHTCGVTSKSDENIFVFKKKGSAQLKRSLF